MCCCKLLENRLDILTLLTHATSACFAQVEPVFIVTYSAFTYIARTIRPILRTLYILASPVLLSVDGIGVRDYTDSGGKDKPVWFGVILRY